MPAFFITGTGTEVGKTVVTAALLQCLQQLGHRAVAAKPIQTGCTRREDGSLEPLDLRDYSRFGSACNETECEPAERAEPIDLLCPYRFEPACSPHLAAEMAGVIIDPLQIEAAVRQLANRYDVVLVEGAGGVLVPISDGRTMLDLAAMLVLPVILVADNRLGCINHALLSIGEIRAAGLDCVGVVMNNMSAPTDADAFIREDNVRTIAAYGEVPILAEVPFQPNIWDTADDARRSIVQAMLPGAERLMKGIG